MRILVAHNVPAKRNGGMSRIMGFTHDPLIKEGHQVDYFCKENIPTYLSGRLARLTFPFLTHSHTIALRKKGISYDIVNVHEPSAAWVTTRRLVAGNPIVVVTSHGVEQRAWELACEESKLGREGPSLKTKLLYPSTSLLQTKIGLRNADHIFCLNFEDKNYLIDRMDISKDKITRIYPGADTIYSEMASCRSYNDAHKLIFAASWRKNKGIEDLVPAFSQLASHYPNLHLTILGGGLPESTIRTCFPMEIQSQISCLTAVDDNENAKIFSQSDIYILPSLFEGTPLTLIEAMMSGLPIITTATCGMKDVIRDGENGLLVPIRSPEALIATTKLLLHNKMLRLKLGQGAKMEALKKYTWNKVSKLIQDTYTHLYVSKKQHN